jgi:hypothetical protein
MPHINQALWEAYLLSAPQQQAVASLVSELERWQIVPGTLEERQVRAFAGKVVVQLVLYGYCIYKLHNGSAVILHGCHAELRWRRGRFVPRVFGAHPVGPRTGWLLLVGDAPAVTPHGEYRHPLSSAYKCMAQTLTRIGLERNLLSRDDANTHPTVFTRVANNVAVQPGGTRPWFTHGRPMAADVSHRVDLEQLMRHRQETITALDQITDRALRKAPAAVLGGRPARPAVLHREHAISDGRDHTEARVLDQSAVVVHTTIDRLSHEIMFAFGVPPQVQGRNINSERMASSNRLNEQAISHFRSTVNRLKAHLDVIFDTTGCAAHSRKADGFLLDQIGHILRPKVARELYALTYGLDKADIDPARLEQATTEHLGGGEKRQKTDETKLAAALKRTPADG